MDTSSTPLPPRMKTQNSNCCNLLCLFQLYNALFLLVGIALFAGEVWVIQLENHLVAFLATTTYKLTSQYKLMADVLLAAGALMVLLIMVLGLVAVHYRNRRLLQVEHTQVTQVTDGLEHEETNHLGGAFCLIGEDETCICGNHECKNHHNSTEPMEDLSDQPDEHKLLHEALSSLEFTTVCRLIRSGMKLCYLGEENCFTLIVKHWTSLYLNSALKLCPSAVNCRGPNGDTLLMLCETPEKFQTVLDHEPNVNATNNDGENVLLYNIKHRLGQVVQNILKHLYMAVPSEESVYDFMIFNLQNVEDQIKEFFKLILNSGVDVEAEDNEGQSAFQLLLKMFKTGYVMKSRLVESIFINPTHKKTTFFYQNKILSSLVSILLEVGAKLPPPDEHGRTPLMLACKSTFNLENIRTLIVRGVDINAVDAGGKNAIFHVLKSIVKYVKHPRWGSTCCYDFPAADQMVSLLLDLGCHMQGTDLLMSEDIDDKFKKINYLMALETSALRDRDFSLKTETKNDPTLLSFLSVYLMSRVKSLLNLNLKHRFLSLSQSDVAFIGQEMANGLDVNCGACHSLVSLDEKPKVGKRRLCSLPSPALLYTLYFKLRYPLYQRGVSVEDSLINDLQGKYQAIEDIQKLLLAFWQLPPLALLLFDDRHHFCDVSVVGILLRKRLMQFLYEVGGPLSPGSKICHAVQKSLVTTKRGSACDQECPFREELLPLFDQLHSEVPSLLHLSRTALRSCLKKTDTRGLDVSSLRVLCQGKMGPIPPDIVDIINFKKASVSQMKVVPDMINYS